MHFRMRGKLSEMDEETFYSKTISERKKLWAIDRDKTALLIIEMQNDFIREGAILEVPGIRSQIPKIRRLIETCRDLGVPIVFTRQVYRPDKKVKPLVLEMFPLLEKEGLREGTEGAEIYGEIKPEPEDIVIRKMGFSAFYARAPNP